VRTDIGWGIAGLAGGVPSPRTGVSFVGHCVTLNTTLNEKLKIGGRQSHLAPSLNVTFHEVHM